MTASIDLHDPRTALCRPLDGVVSDALKFRDGEGNEATLYVLPHVANATAAAFNRAMQITKDTDGGLFYATEAGAWVITQDAAMGTVWLAQHEDVTGDNDPAWMTASAASLEALQDEIDDLVKDNACGDCRIMAGLHEMVEIGAGKDMDLVCRGCVDKRNEDAQAASEMMGDDMAHAWREARA